jgi:hypothetical protein
VPIEFQANHAGGLIVIKKIADNKIEEHLVSFWAVP